MTIEPEVVEIVARLLRSQRTMVLATSDPLPWAAPVYFLYRQQRFYFFSSPRSRHALASADGARCAASVYRDSDDWRDIEGLQMDGTTIPIPVGTEAAAAFTAYVKKFPTVQDFFGDAAFNLEQFITRFRSQLYAFVPTQCCYINNQAGLGKRQIIELPT